MGETRDRNRDQKQTQGSDRPEQRISVEQTVGSVAGGKVVGLEVHYAERVVIDAGRAAAPPEPGDPPYKGLQAYDVADAALFFGRELLTAQLVDFLREHSFLAVVGASGSGKSSLVRAGVVAALAAGNPLEGGVSPPLGSSEWSHIIVMPTGVPLETLARALAGDGEAARTLMETMRADPTALRTFLTQQQRDSGNPTLLVVDQFEELFTLCKDETERQAYIANLLEATTQPNQPNQPNQLNQPTHPNPATIILTLRADFYEACARYDGLRARFETQQRLIGAMKSSELQRVIELPAERGQWAFQVGLVELILEDVGDEVGALPLLSHALLETWRRRSGRIMTLAGYQASGGVRSAIALTAQRVYADLSKPEQDIARRLFLRLVDPGEADHPTRRREERSALLSTAGADSLTAQVLLALSNQDARLVTIDGDKVQIAHEALISAWPQLREWLTTYRQDLQLLDGIRSAALAWAEAAGAEKENLLVHRGGRLEDAIELMNADQFPLSGGERAYIQACIDLRDLEAQRQRRRFRQLALVAAAAVVFAILAGLSAFYANVQKSTADTQRAAAVSSRATAVAERQRAEDEAENARIQRDSALENTSRRLSNLALQQLSDESGDGDPVAGLYLALAALPPPDYGGEIPVEVEHAVRQAIWAARERAYISATLDSPSQVALTGDRLAVGGDSLRMMRADLADPMKLPFPGARVRGVSWEPGPDNSVLEKRLLAWGDNLAAIYTGVGEPAYTHTFTDTFEIRCAAWHPSELRVALCLDDAVVIWSPQQDALLPVVDSLEVTGSATANLDAAWSPDGRYLAAWGARLISWDEQAPGQITLDVHETSNPHGYVSYAHWTGQGDHLVFGWTGEPSFHSWNAATTTVSDFSVVNAVIAEPGFTPVDGALLAEGDGAPYLLMRNTSTVVAFDLEGRMSGEPLMLEGMSILATALSPSGRELAIMTDQQLVFIATIPQLRSGLKRVRLNTSGTLGDGLFWVEDDQLVVVTEEGTLIGLNTGLNSIGYQLQGNDYDAPIALLHDLGDGRLLSVSHRPALGATSDVSLRIWEAAGEPVSPEGAADLADQPLCDQLHRYLSIDAGDSTIEWVEWPTRETILAASAPGAIQRWTGDSSAPLSLPAPDGELLRVAVRPDGNAILRYNSNGGEIWQVAFGAWQLAARVPISVTAAAWAGDRLVVADETGVLHLWSADGAREEAIFGQDRGPVVALDLAADTRTLLVKRSNGQVALWALDAATPVEHATVQVAAKGISRVARIRPGRDVVLDLIDFVARIISIEDGAVLWESPSGTDADSVEVADARWSPTGDLFALATQDGARVYRWDGRGRTATLIFTLPSRFAHLAWSPDGDELLVMEESGETQIVPVAPDLTTLAAAMQAPDATCLLPRELTAMQKAQFVLP